MLLAFVDLTQLMSLVRAAARFTMLQRPDATQLQALLQVQDDDSEFFPVSCI